MNLELKKQLLIGLFAIIVALIGATAPIISAKYNQEFSELKEENSELREKLSELKNESEESINTNTNNTNTDANIDEDPIAQNLDVILQKKAEYTDSDILLIEGDGVFIKIYEKAGYMYNNLQKSDAPLILEGKELDSVTVYFLDYETDDVTYTFLSSKNGSVEYYPGNSRKFYCVIVGSEYELYVSKPIQALGGYGSRAIAILLDKIGDKYSPLFQVHSKGCDSSQISRNYSRLSDVAVSFYCMDRYSEQSGSHYQVHTTDSGIIEHSWLKSFFSLNTRYALNVSLKAVDVSSGEEISLPYITINGPDKSANIVYIFFDYDGSKISLVKSLPN